MTTHQDKPGNGITDLVDAIHARVSDLTTSAVEITRTEGVSFARAAELALIRDGVTTVPTVHQDGCYICEDPEFAEMGLPLCKPCPRCAAAGTSAGMSVGQRRRSASSEDHNSQVDAGHIPADSTVCDRCGYDVAEGTEA
jgi:hypothetical protein